MYREKKPCGPNLLGVLYAQQWWGSGVSQALFKCGMDSQYVFRHPPQFLFGNKKQFSEAVTINQNKSCLLVLFESVYNTFYLLTIKSFIHRENLYVFLPACYVCCTVQIKLYKLKGYLPCGMPCLAYVH